MKTFSKILSVAALLCAATWAKSAEQQQLPMIIHGVTMHQEKLVFASKGRLWQVAREGGQAKAITKGKVTDKYPLFSPDGAKVAFVRENKRNADVYSLDISQGITKRHTYHPQSDWPVSWSTDSQRISFASIRINTFATRLFEIGLNDVMPKPLPLHLGEKISYSSTGVAALVPVSQNPKMRSFRHYRGGQRSQIQLLNTQSTPWQQQSTIAFDDANIYQPMWQGQALYFLSDRDGVANVYRHQGNDAVQLTHFKRHRVRDFDVDDKGLVVVQDGYIQTMDWQSNQLSKLKISLPSDNRLKRQRRINAAPDLSQVSLTPDGSRFIAVARGDVFISNNTSGNSENLTNSNAAERSATMSPDGKYMAYFSDESGQYQLHIQSLDNLKQVKKFAIEQQPGFYLELAWSDDSKKLTFNDHRLKLWLFDTQTSAFTLVAQSQFSGQNHFYRSWSNDSNLLAYGLIDAYGLSRIYVYHHDKQQSFALTDKHSYANYPTFDNNGRYLYYFASPNASATNYRWAVLNGMKQSTQRRGTLKAVVLNQGDEPPMLSGLNQPNLKVDLTEIKSPVNIDYQDIAKRTLAFDIGDQNIVALNSVMPGKLQIMTQSWPSPVRLSSRPTYHLHQLDVRNPSVLTQVIEQFSELDFSHDGRWAYYKLNGNRYLKDLSNPKSRPKDVAVFNLFKTLNPAQEWQQMFDETFNFIVEQLYDPNLHGIDSQQLYQDYVRYLSGVTSRKELNNLLRQMIGFISVSHSGISSGKTSSKSEKTGLLGADFDIKENRYRFSKIYRTGDNENPAYAPLDQLGNRVNDGDYLIAINNQQIKADKNIYRKFIGTNDRVVVLQVADNPQGHNARKVQIQPIDSEQSLRLDNWAEANKQFVAQQSKGKLKYVHIKRFNPQGIEDFLAQFYQLGDAKGLVIDVRYNPGGITSDALIDLLKRKTLYRYRFRAGTDLSTPVNAFDGQTTLLINQFNGSAAETFAQMYKAAELGQIVGKPTYGAGIGPYAFGLQLVDGSGIRVPNRGSYMPNGQWTIENRGVHPHVDVDHNLLSGLSNDDPQLKMAIEKNLEQIEKAKTIQWVEPTYPIHPH